MASMQEIRPAQPDNSPVCDEQAYAGECAKRISGGPACIGGCVLKNVLQPIDFARLGEIHD